MKSKHRYHIEDTDWLISWYSIDVDFPIECDDEYWDNEDPQQNFVQPTNKPSEISYFISLLKLMEIAAYVKRFIVSIPPFLF